MTLPLHCGYCHQPFTGPIGQRFRECTAAQHSFRDAPVEAERARTAAAMARLKDWKGA